MCPRFKGRGCKVGGCSRDLEDIPENSGLRLKDSLQKFLRTVFSILVLSSLRGVRRNGRKTNLPQSAGEPGGVCDISSSQPTGVFVSKGKDVPFGEALGEKTSPKKGDWSSDAKFVLKADARINNQFGCHHCGRLGGKKLHTHHEEHWNGISAFKLR